MPTPRICILIPYFGQWPAFLPLYLQGCAHNPDVDVLFFSDIQPPADPPANVHFVSMTMPEFEALAQNKLGFPVACRHGYKLCDFRPAYGEIFADYLSPYEFWGHGDIDLVYGDIGKFITPELLAEHDIISARSEWLSGPLTLFRNTPLINSLFREEPAHQTILQTDDHCCFDETGFAWQRYLRSPNILAESGLPPSMTLVVRRAALEGRVRARFETIVKETLRWGDVVQVADGRVFDGRGEYLFYHFFNDKQRRYFRFPDWDTVPDRYFIRPTGLYREEEHHGLRYATTAIRRRLGVFRAA